MFIGCVYSASQPDEVAYMPHVFSLFYMCMCTYVGCVLSVMPVCMVWICKCSDLNGPENRYGIVLLVLFKVDIPSICGILN